MFDAQGDVAGSEGLDASLAGWIITAKESYDKVYGNLDVDCILAVDFIQNNVLPHPGGIEFGRKAASTVRSYPLHSRTPQVVNK